MRNLDYIKRGYESARKIELEELANALLEFGGEAHFGYDYTGDYATGNDFPLVVCNFHSGEPRCADVRITCIKCWKETYGTQFNVYGQEIHHDFAADTYDEEISIPINDICLGELKWIIQAIPELEEVPDGGLFVLYGENACAWYSEEGINGLIKHVDEDVWDAHEYNYSPSEKSAYIQGIEDSDGFGSYSIMSADDYHRLMRHTGNEQE